MLRPDKMKEIITKYTNGEITIVWKPKLCIHSGLCWHGLPEVFDPSKRPWVMPENSTTNRIIEQVEKCPSGALSCLREEHITVKEKETETVVEVTRNGPLLISGEFLIKYSDGRIISREDSAALCRCGGSDNKPFCDGTHKKINFTG
jgi:uncharacterized Fe-S cluster protein YjdI/CDGSH-type Zn-finger protein